MPRPHAPYEEPAAALAEAEAEAKGDVAAKAKRKSAEVQLYCACHARFDTQRASSVPPVLHSRCGHDWQLGEAANSAEAAAPVRKKGKSSKQEELRAALQVPSRSLWSVRKRTATWSAWARVPLWRMAAL